MNSGGPPGERPPRAARTRPRAAVCYLALWLGLLFVGPTWGFDVIECDFDDVPGDAGILLGWSPPTDQSIGPLLVDDRGLPRSGISSATVAGIWAAVTSEWVSTDSTYRSPAVSMTSIPPAVTELLFNVAFDSRAVITVDENTPTSFGNGWAALTLLPPGVLAVTVPRADLATRLIVDADIFFNDDTNSNPAGFRAGTEGNTAGGFDYHTVASHEYGHLLGSDHSIRTDALMFPTVGPGVVLRPTEDDRNFVRWTYPSASDPVPPDRNNPFFIDCDTLAATGEVVISHSSSGGCDLAPGRPLPLSACLAPLILGLLFGAKLGKRA